MKYAATLALFCLLAASGLAQAVPEIAFDSNPDFFKLPDDLHFGETAGVAVNSQVVFASVELGNRSVFQLCSSR